MAMSIVDSEKMSAIEVRVEATVIVAAEVQLVAVTVETLDPFFELASMLLCIAPAIVLGIDVRHVSTFQDLSLTATGRSIPGNP